jgi:TonB family protein
MAENNNISSLFDRSGNLRLQAMEKYLRGELSREEEALVEARLAESEFDREALEGFRKHMDENLNEDIFDLESMIMTAGRDRKSVNKSPSKTRYYIAAAASLAAIITVTAILVFQFRQTSQQPELAVVAPDTVLKQVGGVKAPAKQDTIRMHREVIPEAAVAEEAMPKKIDQDASATASPKENQEVVTDVQHEAEPPMEQMIIAEDEVSISQEVSYDDPGQISAPEPLSEAVGGVRMSSQKANYIISDKGKRTMAQEMAMPVEDTLAGGNNIFLTVDQMPSFSGGDSALINYFATNLHYPAEARESNVSGRVFVQFIVEKDGSITKPQILRGLGAGCDEEALRAINAMPRWNPGKQYGQPVRVQCTLPIKFSLTQN